MSPFDLIVFDTYDVAFVRSPRYLEIEVVEALDTATRDVVDEDRLWARLARRNRLTAQDIAWAQERLAAKYCKNLDLWKALPGWAAESRLMLLHGGPRQLLDSWRRTYDLERFFSDAASTANLRLSRFDPELYRRIADDAGLPPHRCLLVDDERAPVDAARQAGFGVYRFGTVYGLRALLAEPVAAFDGGG